LNWKRTWQTKVTNNFIANKITEKYFLFCFFLQQTWTLDPEDEALAQVNLAVAVQVNVLLLQVDPEDLETIR
jgi:hypothetical protein